MTPERESHILTTATYADKWEMLESGGVTIHEVNQVLGTVAGTEYGYWMAIRGAE